jgi:HlyD family secretion protein
VGAAVGAFSVVCFASSHTFNQLPAHHVGNRLKFDQHDRRAKGNRNSATVYLDNKCSKRKLASPVKFGLTGSFVGSINEQQEMKRFFPVFAVAAVLLILLFVVYQCGQTNAAKYQTTTVTRGPLTQAVTATGTLNPVVSVQVGSQVSGNIQKLFVDFNSNVKAGELVAQIDPVLFQATVMQAEGDLASAQAALELARVNASRTQALVAKQNSSQADLDQAMASLHQAEANVKIKQGALDKARADLEHCAIKSPVDGVVISRNVDVGQTVAASLQAPVIFAIANDLTKMQIDSNVAEADIGVAAVGQNVDFTVDAFPSRTFHGKVVQVRNAPIIVQNVVNYDTVVGVSNPDLKLKPGMTANVSIKIAHRDDVLQIKNAALRYRPPDATPAETRSTSPPSGRPERRADRTVYLLNGNHPKPVQIITGISDGVVTEVLEGLKEGDRVITAEITSTSAAASPQPKNPFGAGSRRLP